MDRAAVMKEGPSLPGDSPWVLGLEEVGVSVALLLGGLGCGDVGAAPRSCALEVGEGPSLCLPS